MDNKKSILICSHAMEIGGAERSLLDLLYTFDYEKYDVDLFLYRHSGEWLKDIPEKVNLLPESDKYSSLLVPMTELIGNKQFGLLVGRFAGRSLAKIYSKSQSFTRSAVGIEYSHKYTKSLLPKISPDKKYDLAISFNYGRNYNMGCSDWMEWLVHKLYYSDCRSCYDGYFSNYYNCVSFGISRIYDLSSYELFTWHHSIYFIINRMYNCKISSSVIYLLLCVVVICIDHISRQSSIQ